MWQEGQGKNVVRVVHACCWEINEPRVLQLEGGSFFKMFIYILTSYLASEEWSMTSHNPSSFSTEKQAKTDFRPKNVCIRAYFLLIDLYWEQAEMRTPMETYGNTPAAVMFWLLRAQIRQMRKLTGLSTEFLRLTVIF